MGEYEEKLTVKYKCSDCERSFSPNYLYDSCSICSGNLVNVFTGRKRGKVSFKTSREFCKSEWVDKARFRIDPPNPQEVIEAILTIKSNLKLSALVKYWENSG